MENEQMCQPKAQEFSYKHGQESHCNERDAAMKDPV